MTICLEEVYVGELDVRVGGRGVLLDGQTGALARVLSRTQIHLRVDVPQGEELAVVDAVREAGSCARHGELACAQESEPLSPKGRVTAHLRDTGRTPG